MKITDIQHLQLDSHRFLLVKVITDEGIVGIGEGSGLTGARAWIPRFRDLLVGQDVFAVQRHVTQMLWGMQQGNFITYNEEDVTPVDAWLRRYGASGAALCQAATRAVAAVEQALLDAVGKALETPVYNLLGGQYRDRIPVYLDLAGAAVPDPSAWREEGIRAGEHGFDLVKFDVDYAVPELHGDSWSRSMGTLELRRTVALLEAVRDGLGPDVDLAVDCHGQYNLTDAKRLCQALEPLELRWLEDPLPDFHPEAFVRLRDSTRTPIATGELMQTLFEHRAFIDAGAADILHPDVRFVGGILEYKRVADYADAHYVPIASHSGASPYGTIAIAHANAAVRCFIAQEYHWYETPWMTDLVNLEAPLFDSGCIQLNGRPGFGIEINEEAWLARCPDGWQ